ncbi:hypothetical protein TNIN_362201 [Trichonephila inaurata madagascariensis]|uniref:BTB domain-containing protein n=1 Tax=Trichonephila inaurata madagascariensis TaxID=2747483 RepID=A0A8X6KK69_9ARAC|nr:hypothetical protein TNIN_362201 [Trichonephila inaurata madagascariensis]
MKEDAICTLPFPRNHLMDNKDLYLKGDVLSLDWECSWSDGFSIKGRSEDPCENSNFPCAQDYSLYQGTVFYEIITTIMKEMGRKRADVQQLKDDTVRQMLLYMYTNVVEDLQWESALKLHAVADRYKIVALRDECSSFIRDNMNAENVCDVLAVAAGSKVDELLEAAQTLALEKGPLFQSKA